jgi:hypothetical protein
MAIRVSSDKQGPRVMSSGLAAQQDVSYTVFFWY